METIVFENGKVIQKNQKLKYAGICYVEPMIGYCNGRNYAIKKSAG